MDKSVLGTLRNKWREVYIGCGVYYEELLDLDDEALITRWKQLTDSHYRAQRCRRLWTVYREFMVGKSIFELGSGTGGDGIHFLSGGAKWTFSDVNESSLKVIRRICSIFGLHADFVLVDDAFANLHSLTSAYDAIWINLVQNPIPFELAREECLAILPRLKPGGRWIEVAYDPERFARSGRRNVAWSSATKEERDTWLEPYDSAKLRRRLFPAPTRVILDYNFSNDNERHFDLLFTGAEPFKPNRTVHEVRIFPGGTHAIHNDSVADTINDATLEVTTPSPIWSYAVSFDLTGDIEELDKRSGVSGAPFSIELACSVDEGYIGVLAVSADISDVLNEEELLSAQEMFVTRLIDVPVHCRNLVFRNAAGNGRSRFRLKSASLLR